jgi:hypothetical protein
MATTRLPRQQWKDYFDRFNRDRPTSEAPGAAAIVLIPPTLGDQFEVSALRLLGLAYDPKTQEFRIMLEDVAHLVFSPKEIWVLEGETGFIATLEIVRPGDSAENIYILRGGSLASRYRFPLDAQLSGGSEHPGPANRR